MSRVKCSLKHWPKNKNKKFCGRLRKLFCYIRRGGSFLNLDLRLTGSHLVDRAQFEVGWEESTEPQPHSHSWW